MTVHPNFSGCFFLNKEFFFFYAKHEFYLTKTFEVKTGEISTTTKLPLLFSSLFPQPAGDEKKKPGPVRIGPSTR